MNASDNFVEAVEACSKHVYEFSIDCGAYVCAICDDHRHLDRCYCGWSISGGNGYAELIEMGERIEDDY